VEREDGVMKRFFVGMGMILLLAGTAWSADAPEVYNKKCKACHSIGGVGGPMAKTGGALDDVGAKRDDAWLRAYLKDPKSKMDNAKMPKLGLSDADTDQIVAYLLTLKGAAK
jgi:mono/diheme cytochrome c family protein